MATFVVLSPQVTWTGTPVADSKITWQSATLNETAAAPSYLTTGGVTRVVPGLKQWAGTISGHLGTPGVNSALNVSMTDGYDTNVEAWTLQWNVAAVQSYTTADSDSWLSFLPGVESWSGTYTCKLDDAEPTVSPGDTAKELVLTSSSGNTITGDAIITNVNRDVRIGDIPAVQISFSGDSTLAIAGSNNFVADATDPLVRYSASTLTIKGHEVGTTDVQWSGSAFPTQLSISCSTSTIGQYSIGYQGTGALTTADPAV